MNNGSRLDFLDGLRGIAALIVVIHHLFYAFYPATYTRTPQDIHVNPSFEWMLHDTPLGIFINGSFAVAIFLIVSGYLASYQFEHHKELSHFFRSTLYRFFRFFSIILVVNIVSFILIAANQKWNQPASLVTRSTWWLGSMWTMEPSFFDAAFQSLASLFVVYPIGEYYNSSLWTMPYFFLGTLLVYTILKLTSLLKYRWIIFLLLCIPFLKSLYYLLIIGIIIHRVNFTQNKFFSNRVIYILLLFIGIYFANFPQAYNTSYLSDFYRWLPILNFTHTSNFYEGLGALLIIISIISSPRMQEMASKKLLLNLGKYSFSLYIIHIMVINSLISYLFLKLYPLVGYMPAVTVSIILSLPILSLLTIGLYHFVEAPSQKIASAVYRWLTTLA